MISLEFIKDLFGWLGTMLSFLFFLTPILNFLKLRQGKIKLEDISIVILISNFGNGYLWMLYGIRIDAIQITVNNLICGAISFILILIYFKYKYSKNKFKFILILFILIFILMVLYYLFISLIENGEVVGILAVICNIIIYAAPGKDILKVIKTKNYKLIPLVNNIIGFLCSLCWGVYGYLIKKLATIIPNFIGCILSIIQISIYCIYKRHGYRKCNTQEKEEPKIIEISLDEIKELK